MGQVVVVAGGGPLSPQAVDAVAGGAFIVAADSGLDHAVAAGFVPDVLVGDLDSISAAGLMWAYEHAAEIEEHEPDKELTDTELAIARALLRDPAVMLLDEPFGALDSFTRSQMQDVLTDVWTKNRTTMLFVTHDIEEAITLGDRIVVMSPRPGRIDRVIELGLEHPRDRRSAEFQRVRTELIERFEEIGQGDGEA